LLLGPGGPAKESHSATESLLCPSKKTAAVAAVEEA
jgi:hypothetical protein